MFSLGLVAATAPRSFTARGGLQSVGRRASPGPRGRMRRRLSSLAGPALRGALAARRPGDAPRVVISSRSRSVASVASGSDASARDDDVPPLAYEMVEPPPGTPGASDATYNESGPPKRSEPAP